LASSHRPEYLGRDIGWSPSSLYRDTVTHALPRLPSFSDYSTGYKTGKNSKKEFKRGKAFHTFLSFPRASEVI
jgi:hypothetical protein